MYIERTSPTSSHKMSRDGLTCYENESVSQATVSDYIGASF